MCRRDNPKQYLIVVPGTFMSAAAGTTGSGKGRLSENPEKTIFMVCCFSSHPASSFDNALIVSGIGDEVTNFKVKLVAKVFDDGWQKGISYIPSSKKKKEPEES